MRSLTIACVLAVAGCAEGQPLGTPSLSPVGSGLVVPRTSVPVSVPITYAGPTSLYGERSRELLTDVRADTVGDTLTVVIQINDRATFENELERQRNADASFDFSLFASGRGFDGPSNSAEAAGNLGIGSDSRFSGDASIDRSESLRLLVAVVVTEVLANGNLVVSGTQEVRVNAEVRVLHMAGIVNPLDVTRSNTVSYDKVAEARISYGGRGRSSEIQSPNWGQQLYDRVVPF